MENIELSAGKKQFGLLRGSAAKLQSTYSVRMTTSGRTACVEINACSKRATYRATPRRSAPWILPSLQALFLTNLMGPMLQETNHNSTVNENNSAEYW